MAKSERKGFGGREEGTINVGGAFANSNDLDALREERGWVKRIEDAAIRRERRSPLRTGPFALAVQTNAGPRCHGTVGSSNRHMDQCGDCMNAGKIRGCASVYFFE